MEIILSLLALQAGIIGEPLFVALVIMALATSMTSGAFIQKLLRRKTPHDFTDFLAAKTFCANLSARSRRKAIVQLFETAGEGAGVDAGAIAEAVWKREQIGPTGIGQGLAIPHARIEGLKRPVLALGVYPDGVDFDAPDGQPARLVFLFLTPKQDNETQLEVLASIGRAFHDPDMVERALRANNYTEFLALAKSGAPHSQAPSA
jgi:mannitol/fructose-specific phosphotransferase system IIA component (Ntr-type)